MDALNYAILIIIKYSPLLAVGTAIVVGLWCKYRRKKEWGESYQIATAVLTLFAISYLAIPIVLSYQVPQDILNKFAIASLILALMAITMSNLKDISNDHNFSGLSSKTKDIQESIRQIDQNTLSVLDKVKSIDLALGELKQQNQYQQVKDPAPESAESHNGNGAEGISAN